MKIAILLYDQMTALDAIGPYEVLAQVPGNEVTFVGLERGVVRTDTRALGLTVDRSLDEVSAPTSCSCRVARAIASSATRRARSTGCAASTRPPRGRRPCAPAP